MPPTRQKKNHNTIATRRSPRRVKSIYKGLDTSRQEVRLLHIQPALQDTEPIYCSLSTAFLDTGDTDDDGPHYEALSYAWGTDYYGTPVYIGGRPKMVTVNLYQALLHLRYRSQERVVWIDALCIDQSSPTERTHQVGMMRDVFERAISTTIWLGPSTGDECPLAMKFLERMGSDEDLHLDPSLMPHVEVEGENIVSAKLAAGMSMFFGNPWWSRVWTLQEYVLSRHTIFQHGSFSLEGRVIQRLIYSWKNHMSDNSCCFGFIATHHGNLSTYFNSLSIITYLTQSLEEFTLPQIINWFRNDRHATDPRDKIYGMLGLARNQYERAVVADYTKPIEDVFETATIQMVKHTGSLEVLSSILAGVVPELTLPSWVPDWTASYDDQNEPDVWYNWSRYMYKCNACRDEFANLTVTGLGRIRLSGIRVDEVDLSSTPEVNPAPGFLDVHMSFVNSHSVQAQGHGSWPCTQEFWLTMCGSLEFYTDKGKKFVRHMSTNEDQKSTTFAKLAAWNAKPGQEFWDYIMQDTDVQTFLCLWDCMKTGLHLAITKAGRLAWCPQTCQKGDVIAVIAGGPVPFVLRRAEDDTYRLLGDAYVHGIMHGEAVDEMHNSGKDWEDIDLI